MTRIKELYILKEKATKLANDRTARMHGVDYSYEVAGLVAELCHIMLVAAGEDPPVETKVEVVSSTGVIKMEVEGKLAIVGMSSIELLVRGLEKDVLVAVEGHDPMWLVLRTQDPPIFGLDVVKPAP